MLGEAGGSVADSVAAVSVSVGNRATIMLFVWGNDAPLQLVTPRSEQHQKKQQRKVDHLAGRRGIDRPFLASYGN